MPCKNCLQELLAGCDKVYRTFSGMVQFLGLLRALSQPGGSFYKSRRGSTKFP